MRKNKVRKIIACALIAAGLLGVVPSVAYACTNTVDCDAKNMYNVNCGRVYGTYTYGHQVTDENGYTTWCTVSLGESIHSITCSGCGYEVDKEGRVCFESHSHKYCQDLNYCCQYPWTPPEERK